MDDDLETRWHAVNDEMTQCSACRRFTTALAALAEIGTELLSMDEWYAAREPLNQAEKRHRNAEHPDWWTCYDELQRRKEIADV